MNLTTIRSVLAERRIRLTRSLGQSFLHDGNQLRRIVAAAALQAHDSVLEIGPGLGPLTSLLLQSAGRVRAIEKDARLVAFLRERFAGESRLELIHADALTWFRSERRDWSGWKQVSNLPYSVASPLLVELGRNPQRPERMVVTLQWEVGQRLAAVPGSPDYGVLTLLLGLHYGVGECFRIPASCFFPAPEVDSACVTLIRRAEPLLDEPRVLPFERVVKRGFSQRRKQLRKLLCADWSEAEVALGFAAVGLAADVRAERLTLVQFVELTRWLCRKEMGDGGRDL